MDYRQFDNLAKSLAIAPNRRTLFKGITSGLLGLVGVREVAARSCSNVGAVCREHATCCTNLCSPKDSRSRRYCQCPNGQKACRGACIPLDACCSHDECGALATDCKSGRCDRDLHTCFSIPKADGTRCDDGNACTQTDTCQGGECVGSDEVQCQPLDDCHITGECDPVTGTCSNPDAENGIDCNDGQYCTVGETCLAGRCQGGGLRECVTSGPCWEAYCNAVEGCQERPRGAGASCKDSDLCDGDEICDGEGNCVGGTPTRCGSCGICNSSTGACIPFSDGSSCTGQGDLCYEKFECRGGSCVGVGEKLCPAPDCHTAGTCNPSTGECMFENVDDGTPCAVGNKCVTNATCQSGVCRGVKTTSCPDVEDVCKYAVCDPATGNCITANYPALSTQQKECTACICDGAGNCNIPQDVCLECQTCDDEGNCELLPIGTHCYSDCASVGTCNNLGNCDLRDNDFGCAIGDACNDTYCDETTGQCVSSGENNGKPCNVANSGCGICQNGACQPKACGRCETCNRNTGQCDRQTNDQCCADGSFCPPGTTCCSGIIGGPYQCCESGTYCCESVGLVGRCCANHLACGTAGCGTPA